MAKVIISEKYLYDIANAIRAKLDSQSTYTPAQMAAAIADITGEIAGSITPSTVTGKKLVTDTYLTAIGNAIRAKLDVETLYTPAQMASAILSIESATPAPTLVSWSSGTDAEVAAMIDAAHAGTIDLQQDGGWAVGDVRTISISAFTGGGNVAHAAQDIDIVITSFDEYMSCGNVLQFDFKNVIIEGDRINSTNQSTGGYGAMEIKTTTLPALVDAMPIWMKPRLIEFSVLANDISNPGTAVAVGGNKLALRSEMEVYGSKTYSQADEGTQIDYYENADNRKKGKHNGSLSAWWERSLITSGECCFVSQYGSKSAAYNTNAINIAPFGCL